MSVVGEASAVGKELLRRERELVRGDVKDFWGCERGGECVGDVRTCEHHHGSMCEREK